MTSMILDLSPFSRFSPPRRYQPVRGAICWLLTVTLVGLLAGCQVGPSVRETPRPDPQVTQLAQSLVAQGRLFEAADEYLRLAATSQPPASDIYTLEAATIMLDAGDTLQAQTLLDRVPPNARSPELNYRRALVESGLALAAGDANRALSALATPAPASLPAVVTGRSHYLRALANEQSGRRVEAARWRDEAGPYLPALDDRLANRDQVWRNLVSSPTGAIDAARELEPPATRFAGWLELTGLWQRNVGDPGGLSGALQDWSLRYPGHPADGEFLLRLLQESSELAQSPDKVALLLPFEGPFAEAATAIRDGFAAAWYQDAARSERPELIVLDSSSDAIRNTYDNAVAQGAQFVVGPLRKDVVAELMASGPMSVPTLLLNRAILPESNLEADAVIADQGATTTGLTGGSVTGNAPPSLVGGTAETTTELVPAPVYEFALAPEAEAQEVAARAWFDGKASAAIIAPQGAWGERVASAFSEAWESLGGVVVTRALYPSNAPDMSPMVSDMLNIGNSRERAKVLRGLLNRRIKHIPRRRHDMDMIFMAAFPSQARQLRPTFKFHRAGDVPVYATSHIYTGYPEPAADLDLDDVVFGDMPWMLLPEDGAPSRAQVERLWADRASGLARLYAFGADAYRLVGNVGRLKAQGGQRLDGATGRLGVDSQGRVTRQLVWATFAEGSPVLLDRASPAAPGQAPLGGAPNEDGGVEITGGQAGSQDAPAPGIPAGGQSTTTEPSTGSTGIGTQLVPVPAGQSAPAEASSTRPAAQ